LEIFITPTVRILQATALYNQSKATLESWMRGKRLKPSDTAEGRKEEEDAKCYKEFLDRADKVCRDIAQLLALFAVVCVFGTVRLLCSSRAHSFCHRLVVSCALLVSDSSCTHVAVIDELH
jgi:hypothetical protein